MLVLSNEDVSALLYSLDAPAILKITIALVAALRDNSVDPACNPPRQSYNHPEPSSSATLIMPAFSASSSSSSSIKIVSLDTSPTSSDTSPKGSILLFSPDGSLNAILNASEMTGFRTALGSMIPFLFRFLPEVIRPTFANEIKQQGLKGPPLEEILVFGAGLQAEWAVKLLLILSSHGHIVPRKITVVNRTLSRAQSLRSKLLLWYDSKILPIMGATPDFICHTIDTPQLEQDLIAADAIFCCTPSCEPLFPGAYLLKEEALKKTRYISAIGSYTPDMQEVDPELLLHYSSHDDMHPIIVDTIEGCGTEAGEIIAAREFDDFCIQEISQLWYFMQNSQNPSQTLQKIAKIFMTPNLLYKSVGTGTMDLAVARELVSIARESIPALGVEIPRF